MKRFKVLFSQRRLQVLVAMAALLLAVAVVVGSGANFTASQANAGNIFTTGTLAMTDSQVGAVVTFTTPGHTYKMRPGDVATGTATIKNTGDVPGAFVLTKTMVADAGNMGATLDLLIKEGATTIYTGKLNGTITNLVLGSNWLPAASHTYDFTVTWSNGHPGDSGSDAADNALMGKTCTYDFTWTATANSTIN